MLRTQDKRLNLGLELGDIYNGVVDWTTIVPPVSGYNTWLDAADPEAVGAQRNNGAVLIWEDKSGGGGDASSGTAPIWGTRTINGLNTVDFNGSSQHLISALGSDDRTSTSFFVAMADALTAFMTLRGSAGGLGGNQLRVDQTTGQLTSNVSGVSGIGTQSNAAVTAGVPFLAVQVLTATDVTHYLGATSETDSDSDTFTAGRTTYIGRNNTSANEYWDGVIGEFISYPSALSSGDVALVSAYLNIKWGLS